MRRMNLKEEKVNVNYFPAARFNVLVSSEFKLPRSACRRYIVTLYESVENYNPLLISYMLIRRIVF